MNSQMSAAPDKTCIFKTNEIKLQHGIYNKSQAEKWHNGLSFVSLSGKKVGAEATLK